MAKVPDWIAKRRLDWKNTGKVRPPFAIEPKEGQESVWDYPRPPKLVDDSRRIKVICHNTVIADTNRAFRILETAGAPTIYIPPEDIEMHYLVNYPGSSMCEWKGSAKYWSVQIENTICQGVAWSYPDPFEDFSKIKDYISFYPAKVDCYIDDEKVRPQPGGFYGGWVTDEIVGPIKGEPGVYDE